MTGGGQGMQTRLYGLASDQMTAIDVVLASGVSVTATGSNSYSDLFWALRGAGSSSFGVVTRFTVNIFKMPENAVHGVLSVLQADDSHAAAVADALRQLPERVGCIHTYPSQ